MPILEQKIKKKLFIRNESENLSINLLKEKS